MASQRKGRPTEEKNDNSMLLALLFFLGAGGLIFLSLTSEQKVNESNGGVVFSKKYEESVNRHLMLTNEKIQIQKQRMIVENNALAPEFHRTKAAVPYEVPNQGVDLSPDARAYEVARELGRGERKESLPQTPHEIIQSEVFSQQQHEEYSQSYKEAYAKQFVANAAKNGWAVKLSDDYKVISVTPIRAPTNQMQLFNGDGRSGQ